MTASRHDDVQNSLALFIIKDPWPFRATTLYKHGLDVKIVQGAWRPNCSDQQSQRLWFSYCTGSSTSHASHLQESSAHTHTHTCEVMKDGFLSWMQSLIRLPHGRLKASLGHTELKRPSLSVDIWMSGCLKEKNRDFSIEHGHEMNKWRHAGSWVSLIP